MFYASSDHLQVISVAVDSWKCAEALYRCHLWGLAEIKRQGLERGLWEAFHILHFRWRNYTGLRQQLISVSLAYSD